MPSRQESREAWGQSTTDLHAVRRALARLRYNLDRKRQAQRRLRELEDLLREFGYDPHGSLIGAGSAPLARAYSFRFGRSRRQLFRDLAALRVRNWQEYAPTPTATPTPTPTAMTAAAPPSLTPFARRHPSRPNQSAAPADTAHTTSAAGTASSAGTVSSASPAGAPCDPLPRLLAVLRREPCPTCGRLVGLPARTEHPGPWATAYVALRLALAQQLEPGLVEALLTHAARVQAELRPPRRVGGLPPRPPAQAQAQAQAPAQARPRLTRPSPASASAYSYSYDDLGPDTEVYVWRV